MTQLRVAVALEFRGASRNFPTFFFSVGFPLLLLAIFGGSFGNEPNRDFGGIGAVDVILPAYCALVVAVNGLMTVPLSMAEARERKVLYRMRTTSVRPAVLLLAQALSGTVFVVLGIGVLVVAAKAFFDVPGTFRPLTFLLAFFMSVASIFSIGLLIAALARGERAATVIANLIYFPMIFLAGATVPLSLLPQGVQNFSRFLPLKYSVDLFAAAFGGDAGILVPVAVLGAFAVVSFGIALATFRWE